MKKSEFDKAIEDIDKEFNSMEDTPLVFDSRKIKRTKFKLEK